VLTSSAAVAQRRQRPNSKNGAKEVLEQSPEKVTVPPEGR